MSLFLKNTSVVYSDTDKYILDRMEYSYDNAISHNQLYWADADVDTRFYSGDQTVFNEQYGSMIPSRSKQFNFNRIRRIVEMIAGYQRRNRKSTIVVPVQNGDQETADQFTKILMWQNNQEGTLQVISEAFQGAVIAGMNMLQVWMDYTNDPVSGNIKLANCSYNTFLIDPFFKKQDLSDCNYIWKRSFLTRGQVDMLLPDRGPQLSNLNSYVSSRDGKFQYMPESYDYGMQNLLTYDEFFYRDYRDQKIIIDTQTGETMEWTGDKETLDMYLATYPSITHVTNRVPTIKLAVVVQGVCMYDGPNPMGIDEYPFVPVMAYYTPELPYYSWRIQGVVRGLRDSQFLYNRRKVIELDILESQANSGWIAKEGAFVDPKSPYKTGQGLVHWLSREANMTDVQQIQASSVSPSMFQISDQLSREIMEISGVNEELLGSATDDKAGILSMLRQGAGLTTLQRLFDQLDYSQKLLGRLMIKLIQANFTPGKIERIIEEKPSQQFYHKNFGVYDAAVEEGINTTTQKQMQFAQLLNLREVGIPVPDEALINSATLQDKKKLLDSMDQARQQQAQAQQAQQQMEAQVQKANMELMQARATADRGLGMERVSRIQENQALAVERKAEAQKDLDLGMLNVVKALKEIESIDIAQIEKLLTLAQIVKNHQKEDVLQQPVSQPMIQEQPPMATPPVGGMSS